MGIIFKDWFDSGGPHPMVMDPKSSVEMAGYIPAHIQIENMILAGKRLSDYRKSMYDYKDDSEDDGEFMEVTRSPGFDMADASMLANSIGSPDDVVKRVAQRTVEKKVEVDNGPSVNPANS